MLTDDEFCEDNKDVSVDPVILTFSVGFFGRTQRL